MSGFRSNRARGWCLLVVTAGLWSFGCTAFNPAFLEVVDVGSSADFATIDNAPGHVVVTFINNAEVDERLLNYLLSAGGLVLSDAERRALRPRIRFRVLVTFQGGATMPIEFIDGAANLIDQRFDTDAETDLNQNDLNNVVVLCDVQSVELLPGSQVEVFVPVELIEYRQIRVGLIGGIVLQTAFEVNQVFPPAFRALNTDTVDNDGNIVLRQNIGIRDVAAPVPEPLCGSVISIVLNGSLSVPFLDGVDDDPSYDQGDLQTVGGIGGRYEFIVTVH